MILQNIVAIWNLLNLHFPLLLNHFGLNLVLAFLNKPSLSNVEILLRLKVTFLGFKLRLDRYLNRKWKPISFRLFTYQRMESLNLIIFRIWFLVIFEHLVDVKLYKLIKRALIVRSIFLNLVNSPPDHGIELCMLYLFALEPLHIDLYLVLVVQLMQLIQLHLPIF